MREIKFKVWDTKESKWLLNPKVEFIHHVKSWGNEFYLEISEDWESSDYYPRRYVFVQSTGLKDKSGKEIYEGDILKDADVISRVDWKNGCLGTIFIDQEDKTFVGFDDLVETGQLGGYEVIGNIYENPELIGK